MSAKRDELVKEIAEEMKLVIMRNPFDIEDYEYTLPDCVYEYQVLEWLEHDNQEVINAFEMSDHSYSDYKIVKEDLWYGGISGWAKMATDGVEAYMLEISNGVINDFKKLFEQELLQLSELQDYPDINGKRITEIQLEMVEYLSNL